MKLHRHRRVRLMILRICIVCYDEIHSGHLCGCYIETGEEMEVVNTQMIHKVRNPSERRQRSNNLNEIGGECSRSTAGFPSPPSIRGSRLLGDRDDVSL